MIDRLGEEILPTCSALVKLHLECCEQLWGPQHQKDKELLEEDRKESRGGHRDALSAAAHLLWRQAGRARGVQPGKEKALGRA